MPMTGNQTELHPHQADLCMSSALHSSLSWQAAELGVEHVAQSFCFTHWNDLCDENWVGAEQGREWRKWNRLVFGMLGQQLKVSVWDLKRNIRQWSCLSLLAAFWLTDKDGPTFNSSLWRQCDKLEQAHSRQCDFGQVTWGLFSHAWNEWLGWK